MIGFFSVLDVRRWSTTSEHLWARRTTLMHYLSSNLMDTSFFIISYSSFLPSPYWPALGLPLANRTTYPWLVLSRQGGKCITTHRTVLKKSKQRSVLSCLWEISVLQHTSRNGCSTHCPVSIGNSSVLDTWKPFVKMLMWAACPLFLPTITRNVSQICRG